MTSPYTRADARTQAPALDDAFDLELEQMALAVNAAQLAAPLEEPREPGLARYLKFQAKDYVKHRALPMLLIAVIGIWIFHYNYEPMIAERAARRGNGFDAAAEQLLFESIVLFGTLLFAFVGSLLSAAGIVSRDREGGHQKFLFAKPVRITRFYLQAFAVHGVGLLATAAIVLGLTSAAFLRTVPFVEPMLAVGATYAAVGGLVFLLSTLVRFDLAAGLALALVSIPLREMARRGHWWAVLTSWLFPPFEYVEALNPNPNRPPDVSMFKAVGSMLAYGAAYVSAGIAVLKKRSIIR